MYTYLSKEHYIILEFLIVFICGVTKFGYEIKKTKIGFSYLL